LYEEGLLGQPQSVWLFGETVIDIFEQRLMLNNELAALVERGHGRSWNCSANFLVSDMGIRGLTWAFRCFDQ
jgi:hypothetical protein